MTANGYKISSRGDENILELYSGEGWRALGIHQTPQNRIFLMGEFYGR